MFSGGVRIDKPEKTCATRSCLRDGGPDMLVRGGDLQHCENGIIITSSITHKSPTKLTNANKAMHEHQLPSSPGAG